MRHAYTYRLAAWVCAVTDCATGTTGEENRKARRAGRVRTESRMSESLLFLGCVVSLDVGRAVGINCGN